MNDLSFSLRQLVKRPAFTLIAIVTLALGIGATTAIFSVINAILLKPLRFHDPGSLIQLWRPQPEIENAPVAPATFLDWREKNQVFERMAAIVGKGFNLPGDKPQRIIGARVSANILELLGVAPKLGRGFLAAEDEPGQGHVVVISDALWKNRFGQDPHVIGQTITLSDQTYTVVGVTPAGFVFPDTRTELWVPIAFSPDERQVSDTNFLDVIARLKPGTTVPQAQAAMEALARQLAQRDGRPDRARVKLAPLGEEAVRATRPVLYVLLGAVAFVLVISCANVANLLLARTAGRQKEIAVRVALGASRRRITRLLLSESVLLALIGGAVGLVLATWGIDLLVALKSLNLPRISEVKIDWVVLGFTFLLSLSCGVGFGFLPALAALRGESNDALKEGGRTAGSSVRSRARSLLIIAEIALSLILLIGAGLMLRSFARLMAVDPGFRADHVFTATVALPASRYPTVVEQNNFFGELIRRIESLPGVQSAGIVTDLPLYGGSSTGFEVEGSARAENEHRPLVEYRIASPNYLRAMGASLLAGRAFTERDRAGAPGVVIINETLARQFFPGTNPIGKRIGLSSPTDWREVVGVIKDLRNYGLDAEVRPEAYVPYRQNAPGYLAGVAFAMSVVVQTNADPAGFRSAIQSELNAIDKDQPMSAVKTMEQYLGDSLAQRRFNLWLLGVFAAVALILAAVGIYGVVSYSVAQRRQEMGIRIALGANRAAIFYLVLGQTMLLTALGLALGIVVSIGLTRLMTSMLYHVSATDPAVFLSVAILLGFIALLAAFIPARRATRVSPITSLRAE